jgi:hypothetical protein
MPDAARWLLLVLLAISGCAFSEKPYAVYEDGAHSVRVLVTTKQRMPEALGGEEYVNVRVTQEGREYGPYLIDNNGRFGDSLQADISQDKQWVRLYQALPRPQRGLRTKRVVNGEPSDFFVGAAEAGADAREYRYSIVAYVSTKTDRVYRFAYAWSTQQMRDAWYFGLQDEMKPTQEFEGTTVTWEPAVRTLESGKEG